MRVKESTQGCHEKLSKQHKGEDLSASFSFFSFFGLRLASLFDPQFFFFHLLLTPFAFFFFFYNSFCFLSVVVVAIVVVVVVFVFIARIILNLTFHVVIVVFRCAVASL